LILYTRLTDPSFLYKEDITDFNWSNVPAILVKLGYLTNKNDEKLLINYKFQEKYI